MEVGNPGSSAGFIHCFRFVRYSGQIEKQQEQCDEGSPMPQISTQEFEWLPLRVHDFLAGVPLHDVWAVDLPRARSGITLDEFLRTASACPFTPPPLVRALLNIRLFVGRLLGWDREPAATAWESFATRMTTDTVRDNRLRLRSVRRAEANQASIGECREQA
jgi:hypothetical protein